MLRLRISDIKEERTRFRFQISSREIERILEGCSQATRPVGSALLRIDAYRAEGGIVATGYLHCPVMVECTRCLCEFELETGGRFDLLLRPMPKRGRITSEEVDLDAGLLYYRGNEVELDNYVKDFMSLNIPMQVLCSEECKGLCPRCGRNLNDGDCDCPTEDKA